MSDPTVIQRLVADVARQIRLRRAEFYGLRGLFWGAVAAVVPLLLKETLGPWSYALAGLLLLAGAAAGAAWGLLLSLPPAEAARLADRGYGLQERISTARHFRVFPGEGVHSAEVSEFVTALDKLGYRGDYSFEVFNDDYQQMPLPVVAARARRSAIWLGEDVLHRSVPLPGRMRLRRE